MKLFIVLSAIFLSSTFSNDVLAAENNPSQWSMVAGSGSYMGGTYLGVQYQSQSGKHAVDLSYGQTPGEMNNNVDQLNLKYLYSPFNYSVNKVNTNVLGIGLLASRWQSESAFFDTPSQYPASNYYSPTRWRVGLTLEHNWKYDRISFYFNWTLLDQAIIAIYNNEKFIEGRNPWGAGFGVRWEI